MPDVIPFVDTPRRKPAYRPVAERVKDYRDVAVARDEAESQRQAARCVRCFLPFCHWTCPLGNYVPDWNGYVADGQWEKAYHFLQATNNFPEFTARLCPAPCEPACVLAISWEEVTIRENELAVVEHAFREGWVRPRPPAARTGKSVAVVGSGPAGLACADQLNQAGHRVVVFERDEQPGGILRYGIPDFKLEKWIVDRRLALLQAEGIELRTNTAVGTQVPAASLLQDFDAVCLTIGSRVSRDLAIEGRELAGIHFAMEYLTQSNRRVAGARVARKELLDAQNKRVVVLGGGDTGADCMGTAHRQGARSVTQLEILPKPPETRQSARWPDYPQILRTSSSHEEGGRREWAVQTKRFLGRDGRVQALEVVRVEWVQEPGAARPVMRELPGTAFTPPHGSPALEPRPFEKGRGECGNEGESPKGDSPKPRALARGAGFTVEADLVLLALGFVSPESQPLLEALGVRRDARGNVETNEQYRSSVPGIFAAGDARRGQSLIVWAIAEGRRAAHHIDASLMGATKLPLL